MIIMEKFQKRLTKVCKTTETAVVVGSGIGNLEKILTLFNTVFVFSSNNNKLKAKNLIYRENFDHLSQITEVGIIIFDLDQVQMLEISSPLWTKWKSTVVIEGNDPIDRSLSKSLYKNEYECTSTQGAFHVWEPKK